MILLSKILVVGNSFALLTDAISWAVGQPPRLPASWLVIIGMDIMFIWAFGMNSGWLTTAARRINGECE